MLTVLTELVTELIKACFPAEASPQVKRLISLLVGVFLAFALQIEFFMVTGAARTAGTLLVGLICSNASGYVHHLFGVLDESSSPEEVSL